VPTQYRLALFVIVVGFFVALGIASLAVIVGKLPNADERFKKWAIPGFFTGLTSATFALFRAALATATPFVITLVMPPDAPALKGGSYEYDLQDDGKVNRRTGRVQVAFVTPGGWQAKLPGEVADSPVTLHFEDDNGGWWRVGPFFSNYITQNARKGEKFVATAEARPALPGVAVLTAAEPGREAAASLQAAIRFNNYARPIGAQYGRPTWEWRLFLDEPAPVLNTIASVDYVLHPTFPQPFQSSTDRDKQFELNGSGWGSFNVIATVHFKDGTEAKTTYFLNLNNSWPDATVQMSLDRIHVEWDGSTGPTGWIFDVLADGKPLVSLPTTNYDDGGSKKRGRDYLATTNHWPVATIKLARGRMVRLDVKGHRSFGGDVATGTATVTTNGLVTINVAHAKDPKKGSFVFYFTAKS